MSDYAVSRNKPSRSDISEKTNQSLGKRTAYGAMLMTAQSVLTRVLLIFSQLALAKLLTEEEFGAVGLANAVAAVAGLAASIGIESVLIQRQRQFRFLAQPAFWMSLSLGFIGGLCILLAIPFSAWIYKSNQIWALLLLISMSLPLRALGSVPNSILSIELRFRAIAVLAFVNAVCTSLLSLLFAFINFGASSLVLATLTTSILNVAVLWQITNFRPKIAFHLRRWPYLFKDVSIFWSFQVIWTLYSQLDYLILGLLMSKQDVGTYYFAYTLAIQPVRIATGNLYAVMFPSFASMANDVCRQTSAAVKICMLVPMFLFPLCLAQSFLARPILQWLYPDRWVDSGEIISILSIGLAIYPISFVGEALLHAQKRYREYYYCMGTSIVLFVCFILIGSFTHGVIGTAMAVSFHFLTVTPIVTIVALNQNLSTFWIIKTLYAAPISIALLAYGFVLMFVSIFPSDGKGLLPSSTVTLGIFTPVIFVGMSSYVFRDRFIDLIYLFKKKLVLQEFSG